MSRPAIIALSGALLFGAFSSPSFAQVPGVIFTANPAAMSTCDAPRVANLTWDASAAKVVDVEVLARENATATDVLFAAEPGATGTAKTGAWTRAGSIFTLKDQKTKAVLATVTIGTVPCGK